MAERYCPAYGPGSKVCPRSICDCFIDQFPDDMEQAGALRPEFVVLSNTTDEEAADDR